LVLVVDEAPEELSRLVDYLGAVADKLQIDLVTVAAYTIGDSQVIVPQRVDPERREVAPSQRPTPRPTSSGRYVSGAEDFRAAIELAPEDQRLLLRRLLQWAVQLEQEGLVQLGTFHGTSGLLTLLPRLPADKVGMVTIYNSPGGSYLQFWRRVIERRSPASLARIELAAAPAKVSQGSTTHSVSDELLDALTVAYREAATGHVESIDADGSQVA
jgi:hypothetical protein